MENNKYEQGKKLCEEIFWKTGDIRFYNMAKGFNELNANNDSE